MHKRLALLAVSCCLLFAFTSLSFTQTPADDTVTYRGDINESGSIDIFDLLALLGVISTGPENDRQRDIANVDSSEDGQVNIFDLLALLKVLSGAEEPSPLEPSSSAYEPNDDKSAAYGPLVDGTQYEAYLESEGDEDWYYFDITDGGVIVSLTSLPGDYDMKLYSQDGESELFSSTSGGTSDETITVEETAPGRYYIRIYGYGDTYDAEDSYILGITLTDSEQPAANDGPYEPNDSAEAAYGPLVNGQSYEAYIETAEDLDWYYFDISSGQLASAGRIEPSELPVFIFGWGNKDPDKQAKNKTRTALAGNSGTVTLSSLPGDYDMYLYSSDAEEQIGASSNGSTENESIETTDLDDGRYYVLVYPYQGVSDTTDTYELKVDWTYGDTTNATGPYEPNDNASSAYGPLVDGTQYEAYLESEGDEDWYYFDMVEGGVIVSLTSLPDDYDMRLYSQDGETELASSTSGGTSDESITMEEISSGRYYIRIYGYGDTYDAEDSYFLGITLTDSEQPGANTGPYEPNDNAESAYGPLADGQTYEAYIETAEDLDWFYFDITSGQLAVAGRIEAADVPAFIFGWGHKEPAKLAKEITGTSLAGSSSTVTLSSLPDDYDMYLYSSDAEAQIGASSNGGTESESIEAADLDDGRYYVLVYPYQGAADSTDTYELKVDWTSGDTTSTSTEPYEPNNDAASAYGPLVSGQSYEAYIESAVDQDWYYFDVNEGSVLAGGRIEAGIVTEYILNRQKGKALGERIGAGGTANPLLAAMTASIRLTNLAADYDINLYGSDTENPIAVSEESGNNDESIDITDLADGRYYLAVFAPENAYSTDYSYMLTASWYAPAPVYVESDSIEIEVEADRGATLTVENTASVAITPNSFDHDITVHIEKTSSDSVPLPADMPVLGSPITLDFLADDGQPLLRNYQATGTVKVSFEIEGYSGDPSDVAVVYVGPDSVRWYMEATWDETGNLLSAELPLNLVGVDSSEIQSTQLQGLLDWWKKRRVAAIETANLNCRDDNFAKLTLDSRTPASRSIPVIFIHGWQPDYQTCQNYQAVVPFSSLRSVLLTKQDIQDNFRFYTYQYPTYYAPNHNAQLLDTQINALNMAEEDSLVLVCHSMGGLVARWWMEVLNGKSKVVRLITCGTPHHGSPLGHKAALQWPTEGTRSLRPHSDVVIELLAREYDIQSDKYIIYSGDIVSQPDVGYSANENACRTAKKLIDGPSDGIVATESANLGDKATRKKMTFAGYNHIEMQDGDTQTAGQLDPLFSEIYNDLLDLINPSGIRMVNIPGGTFYFGGQTGYQQPWMQAEISGFQISSREITNAQYAEFLNDKLEDQALEITQDPEYLSFTVKALKSPYVGEIYYKTMTSDEEYIVVDRESGIVYENGEFAVVSGKADHPVTFVTWYGASAFARHHGMRLPTDAEWEYVAKGGREYFYATDDGTLSPEKANYDAEGTGSNETVEVGKYPANPFLVFDMSGNVSEFCSDHADSIIVALSAKWDSLTTEEQEDWEAIEDPRGKDPSTYKRCVARGGSFDDPVSGCSTLEKKEHSVDYSTYYTEYFDGGPTVGFRVAR